MKCGSWKEGPSNRGIQREPRFQWGWSGNTVTTEEKACEAGAEIGAMQCHTRYAWSHYKIEKSGKYSTLESQEGLCSQQLDFVLLGLRRCKRLHFRCFKKTKLYNPRKLIKVDKEFYAETISPNLYFKLFLKSNFQQLSHNKV